MNKKIIVLISIISIISVIGLVVSFINVKNKSTFENKIKLEKIKIEAPVQEFIYGDSFSLNLIKKPKNADDEKIVWESSNPNVVIVDQEGNISIISNEDREVLITAKTEKSNLSSTIKIKVNKIDNIINVTGIKLNVNELSLKYGDKSKINAIIEPENATNKNIIWESNNPNLVSVDNDGNIQVLDNKKNEVLITAKTIDGNLSASVKVFVEKIADYVKVTSLSFTKKEVTIEKGESLQLNAKITPNNATNKKIVWNSNDISIVSVNDNGLLTANSVGTTNITASIDDIKASIKVKVKDTTKPSTSPNLTIKTVSDTYSISNASQHVSEKYYSNNSDINISFTKTEDIEYYAYAIAGTQEEATKAKKTIIKANESINVKLTDSAWKAYYIWGVDSNNNYSKYYTRIAFKYQKIFLESSDYKCLPLNNNAQVNGENCNATIKRTGSTYDNYTPEQKALINRYLNNKISSQGNNKRKAVVAAASFLAGEFDTRISYVSNNFYLKKGLKFDNDNDCWNCSNNKYGLQCSGFVSWALVNGGYDKVANYGVLPGALILSGYLSPLEYAKMYNKDLSKVSDNNLIVSKNNILDVNSNLAWERVKEGDIVGYAGDFVDGKYSGGHVGIIIKLDSNYIYIAHNALWSGYKNGIDGLQITRYQKSNFYKNNKFGTGKIVLMDEAYNS